MRIILYILFFTSITFGQVSKLLLGDIKPDGVVPTIAFIDSATTGSDDTLITFTHWGSIVEDQVIILIVFNEGDAIQQYATHPYREPTDFTYIDESPTGVGMGINIGAFYKVATGSETGTFEVHVDQLGELCGWYIVLDNVDVTDVLNASSTPSWVTADSTLVINELTTDEDNCLVFGVAALDGADETKWEYTDTGWAFEDDTRNSVSPFSIAASFALKQMVAAGATVDVTVNTGVEDGLCGFQFAIKGAP